MPRSDLNAAASAEATDSTGESGQASPSSLTRPTCGGTDSLPEQAADATIAANTISTTNTARVAHLASPAISQKQNERTGERAIQPSARLTERPRFAGKLPLPPLLLGQGRDRHRGDRPTSTAYAIVYIRARRRQ